MEVACGVEGRGRSGDALVVERRQTGSRLQLDPARLEVDHDDDAVVPFRISDAPGVPQVERELGSGPVPGVRDDDDGDLDAVSTDHTVDGVFDDGVVADDACIVGEPAVTRDALERLAQQRLCLRQSGSPEHCHEGDGGGERQRHEVRGAAAERRLPGPHAANASRRVDQPNRSGRSVGR